MGFSIVVVVNGERADKVAAVRERDVVAILFAGGEGEVTESLFVLETEVQGLGDDGDRTAGGEIVGKPGGVEGVGGRSGGAVVKVEASVCKKKNQNEN